MIVVTKRTLLNVNNVNTNLDNLKITTPSRFTELGIA